VWIEDPGYSGAREAFENAGARIVPVRVDDHGLDPAIGRRLCPRPKAVYLTPAHQFVLGTTLSLERRFDLLRWAGTSGAVLIEDDYDSEFRFSGRPVPAMKSLDDAGAIFLIGTFNKVLFPALRLGYIVVPDAWIDAVIALRYQSDRYPPAVPQAILARFIEDGHFARHLRRMRELYGRRRQALAEDLHRYLRGALEVPDITAGLSTPAYLLNGMSGRHAATLATEAQLETWSLDRFALKRRDLRGLLLGFAAFTPREIRAGVQTLARALS
jgi:GntR family transcriptional regulator/MocR family aminotransferase